jgi:hypothetical protein
MGKRVEDGLQGRAFDAATLGYPVELIRGADQLNARYGPCYVPRRCDGGCGRTLSFWPMPGALRVGGCVVCGRQTGWVVVGAPQETPQ